MASINISAEDVNTARNFLVQYLRDCGYEGSVEDGTAIHDALIKPMALLYTLFKSEAQKASAYFSLEKARQIKDALGIEYDTVVDTILSNWFVTRRQGSDTEADIKLIFTKPQDYLRLVPGQALCTIDGSKFEVKTEEILTDADFEVIFNSVENTNEYAVTVACKTMEPCLVQLTTDSAVTCHLSNIYLQRAEVAGSIKLGTDIESSDAFIARTETAITTRELISDRAIKVELLEALADVIAIYVARYGSGEQLRDVKTFDNVTVHVGNMADIYLKHLPVLKTSDFTVGATNDVDLAGFNEDIIEVCTVRDKSISSGMIRLEFSTEPAVPLTIPVTDTFTINGANFVPTAEQVFNLSDFLNCIDSACKYILIEVKTDGGAFVQVGKGDAVVCSVAYENLVDAVAQEDFMPLPVSFTLSGVVETEWGAAGKFGQLTIPSVAPAGEVQVDYLTTQVVADADAFINAEAQRVACYSPMARSMFPVRVEMDLVVRQIASPSLKEDALAAKIAQVAAAYTNSIPWQRAFSVSEFVHYLHDNIDNIEQVLLPATFTAHLRDPADLSAHTSAITGVYSIPAGLSAQATWNTIQFFTDPSWVKVRLYR